jgi:hypothetical protein
MTEEARVEAAQAGAFALGHRLIVVAVPGGGDATHKALAGMASRELRTARFLAYGDSPAAAADNGLSVLTGIVERGDAWPRAPKAAAATFR